jgi:hypothetical protein
MNGTPFKLATYAATGGGQFPAIVLGDDAIAIAPAYRAFRDSSAGRAGALGATESLAAMLEDWDANFAVLQAMVAFIEKEGVASPRFAGATAKIAALRPMAPVQRPGKILNAAQNFQEHVNEMIRAGMSPADRQFTGERSSSHPYMFLKASDSLAGAFDDIAIPQGMTKIDWVHRHRPRRQAHPGFEGAGAHRRVPHRQRCVVPRHPDAARPAGPALGLVWRQVP